jgi:GTP-binding protein Era
MTDTPNHRQDPETPLPCPTQSGIVLFLGVPNAGKSSLLNAVLGVKLAAVSHKPNMTRFCITGVHTEGTAQMILMDAPGLMQSPQNFLEKTIQTHLKQTLTTVDMVVAVVDVATAFHDREQHVYALLARETKPVLLVLNKIDTIKKTDLLPMLARFQQETPFWKAIIPVSAQKRQGIDRVLSEIKAFLPSAPWLCAEDDLSTLPMSFLATEATREQIYKYLHDELPYHLNVTADAWETKRDGSAVIRQTIWVDQDRYRRILLGHKGQTLKTIGEGARHTLSRVLGHPVHLFLTVMVDSEWTKRMLLTPGGTAP